MRSSLSWLPIAALPFAWLLPNHYPPWPSAWLDGLALGLLAGGALASQAGGRIAWHWLAFAAVAATSATLQAATGQIFFAGDAIMVLLYLGAFLLALAVGNTLDFCQRPGGLTGLEILCIGLLAGALASAALAVYQWTGGHQLGIWVADLPPGGRPFANVAQPNHLCSVVFLGLASASLLRHRQRLWMSVYWALVVCLLACMVMTSSRTGWLQIGLLVVALVSINRCHRCEPGAIGAVFIGLVFAAMTAAWPTVSEFAQPVTSRQAEQMLEAGTRPRHWTAMMDAINQQWLSGYGWQQVSVAQVRVADRQPFVGEHIEHSHNIVLDLLVWAGVPLGSLLVLLALTWFVSRRRTSWQAGTFWPWLAAAGLVTHALLEFPLEYAYFLVPFGLFIGAVDRSTHAAQAPALSAWPLRAGGAVLAVALTFVGADYLEAESANRTLRMESAHIGSAGLVTAPPQLRLLTQQAAFLRFAHTEARPGMEASEVEWMHKVSERFAYPPVMLRHALAAGLNGRPAEAELTLKRLCLMHPRKRCTEGIEAWKSAQQKFPVLHAVNAPVAPP